MPKRMIRDWTDSEKVNSLTAQAERFFLRVMMKADDFGRFNAAPRVLRGMLFPLLVDTVHEADISRWLAECERAGLIWLYADENDRPLLEIVNFGQRMDKAIGKFPEPSVAFRELPGISGNFPPEEKRREKEIEEKEKPAVPELVLPFESEQFRDAWSDFVAMRSEIKKPLKPTAIKLSFAKLVVMGEATAIQSLKESTANQWQGLFEPKEQRNGNGTGLARPGAGGTNLLTREQQREQQQLGVIAGWAAKRSVPANGVRQGDGALVGDEANRTTH